MQPLIKKKKMLLLLSGPCRAQFLGHTGCQYYVFSNSHVALRLMGLLFGFSASSAAPATSGWPARAAGVGTFVLRERCQTPALCQVSCLSLPRIGEVCLHHLPSKSLC